MHGVATAKPSASGFGQAASVVSGVNLDNCRTGEYESHSVGREMSQ